MGFLDKAKAGLSNAGNYTEQKAEEARFDGKIYDQKRDKEKAVREAGEKMYAAYLDGKTEITDDVKALFEKAKACEEEIKKLEEEKQNMIDKAHNEREARRTEVSDDKKE